MTTAPLFSICIPNYNYRTYLELTCKSVTDQDFGDYEIAIADNRSTDGSDEFVKRFASSNTKVNYTINSENFGFAGNLERVTSLAKGSHYILLSSDDLMNPGALSMYNNLLGNVNSSQCVIGSSVIRIDSNGKMINQDKPNIDFWRPSDINKKLSHQLGAAVYEVNGPEMLQRCLTAFGNPYHFLTVCYSSMLFEKVGGYSGGRMFNPDKWFNWKLFAEAETVYLIDKPLFSYRWHQQNQAALETSLGHLKFLVDDYRNCIETSDKMLTVSRLTRSDIEKNFINRDIYRHGIGEFLKGRWIKSFRVFCFGLSVFPWMMLRSSKFLPYMLLLLTTPLGSKLSSFFFKTPK